MSEKQEVTGVAFGPGHQPTASAADASSQSGVPNAGSLLSLASDLMHPTRGILRGIYATDDDKKLLAITVAELRKVASLTAAALAVSGRYHELLFAVSQKHQGEDRHATALRYIRERDTASAMSASGQDPKGLEAKPASATGEAGDAQ